MGPSLGGHNSVLRSLFGDFRLENITSVLLDDINGLLLYLQEPLGTGTYGVIKSEPSLWRRTEALLLAIEDHKGDKRLAYAFQKYVLDTEHVYDILTPDAQRKADERRFQRSTQGFLYLYEIVHVHIDFICSAISTTSRSTIVYQWVSN